jgi:Fe-S-cluster containining protein
MERLAQALDIDVAKVMQTYLQEDEQDGWELLAPCPLLDGKLCSVYDARPTVCREYPHLHNDFRAASVARIHNAAVCPIVFNVIEGMKVELDWFDDEELDWLA